MSDSNSQPQGKKEDQRAGGVWWLLLGLVTLASLATRLHGLDMGSQVCWDETHFGKFAGWYINRTYFFDVHPPLGKLLIAGIGRVVGYNGTFGFQTGQDFSAHPEVAAMRCAMAVLGAALAPAAFVTAWQLTGSCAAAGTAASLVVFDTGFTSLTRYILLDQPLLLAIAASFHVSVVFGRVSLQPGFSPGWVWRLGALGLLLGAAVSVKLVGVFMIAYVGLLTLHDLWHLAGDPGTSPRYNYSNILLYLKYYNHQDQEHLSKTGLSAAGCSANTSSTAPSS